MSDSGRKNFTDKIGEAVTPESCKSATSVAKEAVTNIADTIGRKIEPEDKKSVTQCVADKIDTVKDEHVHGGTAHAIFDHAKEALGFGSKSPEK